MRGVGLVALCAGVAIPALVQAAEPVRTVFGTLPDGRPVDAEEIARRRAALEAAGGYAYPASQTPWQAIQRAAVGQMHTGAILEGAERFQRIAQTSGLPRDNH